MNNNKYKRRLSLFTLYSSDGRILLQKRDLKAPTLPGYWAFFGGGMENEEFPIETVKRESREELGLKFLNPVFLNRYIMRQDGGLVEKFIFIEKLKISLKQLKKNQKEGETLGLFKLAEIKKNLLFPKYNIVILDDIEKYLNKLI
jgi:8-oxo-dGTP pyrophosphatase MutT (NUDIX family)